MNELLSIFKAITPDNIKDIPLISDGMEIFIELLTENSKISSEIRLALSEETTSEISEELSMIYLRDYSNMINNLRTNKAVVNKFKKWNEALKPNIYPVSDPVISDRLLINYFKIGEYGEIMGSYDDIEAEKDKIKWNTSPFAGKIDKLAENILKNTAENYYINRKFKESKGLKKSINFIYDVMNEHMVNPDEIRALEFSETGKPFELEIISGSIDKDLYTESVAYISHPLGFTYDYTYMSELNFVDIYGLRKFYEVRQLEVRCLNGDIDEYPKEVSYIEDRLNYLKIVFMSGNYLLQENDVVKCFDKDDNLIKIYPEVHHCSIYVDYEIVYRTSIEDVLSFEMSDTFEEEPIVMDDLVRFKDIDIFNYGFIIGEDIIGDDIFIGDADFIDLKCRPENYERHFIIGTSIIGDVPYINEFDLSTIQCVSDEFSISPTYNFVDDLGAELEENIGFKDIEVFNSGFYIGYGVVGKNLISNDIDMMNPNTEDKLKHKDIEVFDFGLMVGEDVIGNQKITSDSDSFGLKLVKDIIKKELPSGAVDTYSLLDSDEEFDIQTF